MKTMTQDQIRETGLRALSRELGAVGAVRFIQQFETGRGDYTAERAAKLPKLTLKELASRPGTARKRRG